jgi:hypothetical protein
MTILAGWVLLIALALVGLKADPRNLQRVHLRGEVAILILFALQAVARGRLVTRVASRLTWNPVLPWALATGLLLALVLSNARQQGMPLAAAGLVANLLVVVANWGMPISLTAIPNASGAAPAISDSFYVALAARTHFPALADVLPAPAMARTAGLVFSVGDVLLLVGVSVLVISASVERGSQQPGVCTSESPALN